MPETRMLINYVPGEECRVAIVEDGKLEEFHAESADAISRVGNIYLARVINVEAAIQAAFVDFGIGENGFLHVSDLHPRYFPGEDEDTSELVGRKTPRRERPPIQQALRRGQEILVQVIKEGVGTKGPTLTSYLSIPGRFLVMMPQMDKVGVSRKVEDEDVRRQMRQILDTLDLPDGFGFILRTAGFDRTKLELKRDLSYLQRLWKDMERRMNSGKAPRLLYSESDLLVRTIRDALTNDIDEVVIDNEHALQRAAKFLKIVSPKSRTQLLHFRGKSPIFHAYGIEPQILQMHAREVPLPSGGRLVIDETEALVAVDVNSGRSRDARDAESNAYNTNVEAVDAICRHLRLRDLGGLVILDLIDMRSAKNRKDIEARFRDRLKRDRAKSTILPISEFGILEMTRQRMRGSHERVHFTDCPTCHGRGLVQRPSSVAADALRELSAVLEHDKVARVEMVVSPRVAGELLSQRRKALNRIERSSGKGVEVRVSETHPVDRITLYAYDASGTDVGLDRLNGRHPKPDVVEWDMGPMAEDWSISLADEAAATQEEPVDEPVLPATDDMGLLATPGLDDGLDEEQSEGGGRKKRRRRRGRGRGRAEGDAQAPTGAAGPSQSAPSNGGRPAQPSRPAMVDVKTRVDGQATDLAESGATGDPASSEAGHAEGESGPDGEGAGGPRRRRRRRRGGRGRGGSGDGPAAEAREGSADERSPGADTPTEASEVGMVDSPPPRGGRPDREPVESSEQGSDEQGPDTGGSGEGDQAGDGGPRRRRRRRGGRGRRGGGEGGDRQGDGAVSQQRAPQATAPERQPPARSPVRPVVVVPPPPPPPGVPAGAKPRSLYGGSRRKLAPSEVGKSKARKD